MNVTDETYELVELRRVELPAESHVQGNIVTVGRMHQVPGFVFDPNRDVGSDSVWDQTAFIARTNGADYYGRPSMSLRNPKSRVQTTAGVVINLTKVRAGERQLSSLIAATTGRTIEPITIGDANPWGNRGKVQSVVAIKPEDLRIEVPSDGATEVLPTINWLRTAEAGMQQLGIADSAWDLGTRCLKLVLEQYEAQTC